VLLSRNVQSEHVAAGEVFKQRYYGNINNLSFVGQWYFQVIPNLNMSQQWKVSKQRYYRTLNTLGLCRPLLLSGYVQSEHVAAVESIQATILSDT